MLRLNKTSNRTILISLPEQLENCCLLLAFQNCIIGGVEVKKRKHNKGVKMPKSEPQTNGVDGSIRNLKRSEWDQFVVLLQRLFCMDGTSAEKKARIMKAIKKRDAEWELDEFITIFDGTLEDVI